MKVLIEKPFRSKKYQRVMVKGEVMNGTKDWAEKIEKDGLGKIIEVAPKVKRRTKKVLGKEVETTAIEVNT